MKRDYARTTITVPFELKARMKKARAHVNWSAIACEAFERKLDELGPIEEITSVEDALARMKSLVKQDLDPQENGSQSGKEAGTHWALNFARPSQLRRIAELHKKHSEQSWKELLTSREGWKALGQCIEPDHGCDNPGESRGPENHDETTFEDIPDRPNRHRRRSQGRGRGQGPGHNPGREIWRSILDRRPDHPSFLLGFATGALEVWDQIKDQF